MKKALILLAAVLIIFCTYPKPGLERSVDGDITLYVAQTSIEGAVKLTETLYAVECGTDGLKHARKHSGKELGMTVTLEGDGQDYDGIVKKLGIRSITREKSGNTITAYGYSSKLGAGVMLNGKKVNVQIALSGGIIKVGTPLIMGDY